MNVLLIYTNVLDLLYLYFNLYNNKNCHILKYIVIYNFNIHNILLYYVFKLSTVI